MKIFTTILLLLLSFSLISQIKINGFIETGYFDEKVSVNVDKNLYVYCNEDVFYSDITLNLSLKNVHFEQQLFNVFGHSSSYNFNVISIRYKTRLYYEWKSLNLGVEHMCLHPIISQHNELPNETLRGSHDKIFIRFTFEN